MKVVQFGNVPKPFILSCGTMGWDGLWDLPSEDPWYDGMGWKVGIYPVRVVQFGNVPKPLIHPVPYGTTGWDGQLGFTQ